MLPPVIGSIVGERDRAGRRNRFACSTPRDAEGPVPKKLGAAAGQNWNGKTAWVTYSDPGRGLWYQLRRSSTLVGVFQDGCDSSQLVPPPGTHHKRPSGPSWPWLVLCSIWLVAG